MLFGIGHPFTNVIALPPSRQVRALLRHPFDVFADRISPGGIRRNKTPQQRGSVPQLGQLTESGN
eukprot:10076646-Alexandrium_andersonii.AAC.1